MIDLPTHLNEGRYVVAERLGQGGMAVVHKCWDESLGILRAVKFLLPELAASKRARQRFQSEAHAMARVEHANVLRVYDVGEMAGLPFMVAEYAPGGSIERWSELHGRMPPRLAADVIRQICRGVGAAHDEGIVHRDIKPDNVLVCRKGTCKVTDFGIAQVMDHGGFTRTGSTMGTLAYMAPEQRKDAKGIGRPADVYAIGATMWSLLSGEVPMDLFMTTHDPSLLGDHVPAPLRPVLLKALHYRPEERFADTHALHAAIDAVVPELDPLPMDTPGLITRQVEQITERPPSAPSLVSRPSAASSPSGPSLPSATSAASQPTLFPDEAAPSAGGGRPLPYFMPAQDLGPSSRDPSWIDEDADEKNARRRAALAELQKVKQRRTSDPTPIPTRPTDPGPRGVPGETPRPMERGFTPEPAPRGTATPAPTSRTATPAPASRTATPAPRATSTPAVARELIDEVAQNGTEAFIATMKFVLNPLKWFVIPAFAVVFMFVGYLTWSAWQLQEVANAARDATDGLVATIDAEARVIEDLREIGAQWQLPDAHRVRLPMLEGRERVDVAMLYLQTLHEQEERFLHTAPPQAAHRATMARERIARLDTAVKRYQDAMLAWERAADSSQGRTVCGLGMASCP